MKAIGLVLLFAKITRPPASLTVALLFLSGGILSPRALALDVQTYLAGKPPTRHPDFHLDTRNKPEAIQAYPIPNTNRSGITSPQLRAFLDTIAWAETGTTDLIGYHALVFNGFFFNFKTHPKIQQCARIDGRQVCSNAAGRYQMMGFNWDELAPKLRLKDFSPKSQDKMALYLIGQKKAMPDVLAGRFDLAACKVGSIWASIPPPCNNYGQSHLTMTQLRNMYHARMRIQRGKK